MIHLENAGKVFGGQVILKEGSLRIHPGEKVGLIGPNGAGKTTLLRIIEGQLDLDQGELSRKSYLRIGTLQQDLEVTERPILTEALWGLPELMRLRAERQELQEVLDRTDHADPLYAQFLDRWGEIEHRLDELDSYSAESRAGAILLGLGFTHEALSQPFHTFSGGWRLRVALARLLFAGPDLMLLDEPTNHLDLESVAWLENHLRQMPTAFIAVSHDRGFLNRVARITVELASGRLSRYQGSVDAYLEYKLERIQQREKEIADQSRRIETMNRFIQRFRAKATKARQVQSRIKQLARIEPLEKLREESRLPAIRLPEAPKSAQEMVKVDSLSKRFDSRVVFDRARFQLRRGEKVGLLGPNGAGKTTFLKLLTGLLPPDSGKITLGDRVVVAYFAQHALETLDPDATVLAQAMAGAPTSMTEQAVRTLLGSFLFSGDEANKLVGVLSGGEKARLALVRLFLSGANLLLLDEPTNHLDMEALAALEEALESYQGSLLLVSHDRDFMASVCDRYVVVARGEMAEWGGDLEGYLNDVVSQRELPDPELSPPPKRPSRKDVRRLAAEIRTELQQKTRSLRSQAATLEARIQALESERDEMERRLSDPALYEDAAKAVLKGLLERSGRLATELDAAMARWEETSLEIEGWDEKARLSLAQLDE
ncbi:MAG: ATP-binding cassette domain-containing protein [Magnetococcales bacterium]|nr:ATP-binding cassette domain-containing protein [Magnetococcales bacterium]MBF0155835.1 ATP-binding cassette domain-containing protein [Magnetococcales bacterium]